MQASTRAAGLELTQLVTPTTPQDRMKRIAAVSEGFVYLVSVTGTPPRRYDLSSDSQTPTSLNKKENLLLVASLATAARSRVTARFVWTCIHIGCPASEVPASPSQGTTAAVAHTQGQASLELQEFANDCADGRGDGGTCHKPVAGSRTHQAAAGGHGRLQVRGGRLRCLRAPAGFS